MTLQSSGQITALDILVESRRTNGTAFDINQSVFRTVGKKPTVNSEISYADFYGRAYQKDFKFGGSGAANYCTNPLIGYLSDYITGVSVGDTFQVVIAFQGSWAPINGQYPAIEVYCTYGVAQYFDFAGNAGGKVAHMTFSYNGGDVITLSGYYSGGSTSFPCATVYLLNLSYPEPQNRGSGYTNTGVEYTTYLYYNPATHGFINHWTPPPAPPAPDPSTSPADSTGCCFSPESLVMMADMTYKPIIDIQIGEQIISDSGKISTVINTNRTIVGSRKMIKFANSNFMCTEDHLFLTDKGWKTWDPAYLIDNNRPNAVFLKGPNIFTPIQSGDKLRIAHQNGDNVLFDFVDYDSLGAISFDHPADYAVYDLDITDGVDDYIVEGFVVHNCGNA